MIFAIVLRAQLVLLPKFTLGEVVTTERAGEIVTITEGTIVVDTGDIAATTIGTMIDTIAIKS